MLPSRMLVRSKIAPPQVASIEHLMAIACGMEREAGRRYREVALRMRLKGEEELDALFTFLSKTEDEYAADIDARAVTFFGQASDPAALGWHPFEQFDEEDAHSAGLSAYRALAIAVRNKERAFEFYSYIAAYAQAPDLQRLAEQFAMDELAHAGLLRRERRKAWRARVASFACADPYPETIETLLAQAASAEQSAATAHRTLAARLRATQRSAAASLFDTAADDEDDLARTLVHRLPPGTTYPEHPDEAESVRDGLKLLEVSFERYAWVTEHSTEEAVMLEAQALSERALRRLAHVRGGLDASMLT
jgi:rubrerythrin